MTEPYEALEDDVVGETTVSVVVADDHPMWRDAVARDLTEAGFNVVATADDGYSAVSRTLATRPDVLVLDLNLPGLRGDQVCEAIVAAQIPTRVLILSASAEQHDVLEAVKVGATGYLLKSASRDDFLDAVRATALGNAVFTPGLAGLVLGEFRRMAAEAARKEGHEVPGLTVREIEVLKLVATGMSYKQIGEHLFISHRTVQNHVQNTLIKLQLHNRVQLVRFAIAKGLDTPT
ncbi:MAG TPA: response regulator transcription factor [Dermatophilaceae bacterium]